MADISENTIFRKKAVTFAYPDIFVCVNFSVFVQKFTFLLCEPLRASASFCEPLRASLKYQETMGGVGGNQRRKRSPEPQISPKIPLDYRL